MRSTMCSRPRRQTGQSGNSTAAPIPAPAETVGGGTHNKSRHFSRSSFSLAVGQESEVADADETLGEYMLEESPQELSRRDGHLLLLVPMP
jgi:hypothetical protein